MVYSWYVPYNSRVKRTVTRTGEDLEIKVTRIENGTPLKKPWVALLIYYS